MGVDRLGPPQLGMSAETADDRLRQAEETLAAIVANRVDGFVVKTSDGERVVLTDRGVERPYRVLVDAMNEGAATLAPGGSILYANRRFAISLATAVDAVLGANLFEYLEADEPAYFRSAVEEGLAWRGEVAMRDVHGKRFPALVSLTPLGLEGTVGVLSLLLTDLRERRRADALLAAGQLAQRIFDTASEAVVVCDASGVVQQANREAQVLCGGFDPSGMPFARAFELVAGDAAMGVDELLQGSAHRLQVGMRRSAGELRLLASAAPLTGEGGARLGSVVTLTDVTDLHAATQRLERHARRQEAAAELSQGALAGEALDALVRRARAVMDELLDGSSVRTIGSFRKGVELRPGPPAHAQVVRRDVRTHDRVLGLLEIDPGCGRALTPEALVFVDHVTSVLCMAAEQRSLHARLHHEAHHDPLTGLPNRVLLEDRLDQAIARARRDGTRVAVLFLDLDRFKHVNDTLGHQAGNDVLIQIADRLRRYVRKTDTVARVGGDEFVVIHGDLADDAAAEAVAAAVAEVLAGPIAVAGRTVRVRATVGVSAFPRDGDDTDALLTKSDSAMYYGKRGGRNTIRVYREDMSERAVARMAMEHDLEAALQAGELELFFQPQVSPLSGAILGVESLTRWRHPRHGWIPPTQFVPMAEEAGLVGDLGSWAISEACRVARPWTAGSWLRRVSVNVSPAHVARPGFAEAVRRSLEAGGLAPGHLELEITESVLMHDVGGVVRPLAELRELGVTIALDDFGLGYASFSSLGSLPLDRLKVDKSLIDTRSGLHASRDNQMAVLLGITTMARALGLQVTIEGVETLEELEMARRVGCDEVQGYLFAGPQPAARLGELLERGPLRPHTRDARAM
jgi:diguanylate cyclase (GGDEF)-like protein